MKTVTIFALHLGYGGVEQYISSLTKMLEKFAKVKLIVTYKLMDKPAFEFSDNIEIEYLIDCGPNKIQFRKALKRKNIYLIIKEGIKALKILYLKKHRNIKAIKKEKSDYIITTRFHSKLVGKYADKNIIKIATEHNFHNNDQKYIKSIISSINGFDYFVVVSENLKQFYEDKIGNTKCLYIPNVIDNMPNSISKLNTNNIICVGRFSQEKCQKDLIDVINIVKITIPDIKLFLIGDGELYENLKKYANDLKLINNIVFTGFLSKKEMEPYFLNSTLFALTSLTESFGIVLIEAMSYGLPCIAFDSADGAKKILKNDVGILITNRDKSKMAKEIINILNDRKKAKKISQNGLLSCQQYLLENVSKKWEKILNN